MTVQLADALDFLVARSMAPSTIGAQLDRLRNGVNIAPDPFRARDDAESQLLQTASLLRCLDEFVTKTQFVNAKTLEKIQKSTSPRLDQGYIALALLRAYHERSTTSQERGLVEIHRVIVKIAPRSTALPPKDTDEDLLQMFRTNKAKRARSFAAEAYGDSLLALQTHIASWNRRK